MIRRFFTPGWFFGHILVTAALLLCMRLAWWQLARSHEIDGGAQNLGYALLWPLFGAAFVYMWVKFIRLEFIRDNEIDAQHTENVSLMLAEAEEMTAAASRENDVIESCVDRILDHESSESAAHPESDPVEQRPPDDIYDHTHLDENEDIGLIAYNRALAALAEQDHRRAR